MDITQLIHSLNTASDALPTLEDPQRRQLLQACDKLKTKLETPFDTVSRLVFSVWNSPKPLPFPRSQDLQI